MSWYNELHDGDLPATEEWARIPGYPGYHASTTGVIKSKRGRISVRIDRSGNHYVQLWKGGKAKYHTVGRLVLLTHVGPPPPGTQCCHGPKGRSNHSIDNLSWGTPSKNNGKDRKRDGTLPSGEQHGNAKLSRSEVAEIKTRLKRGDERKQIAKEYRVSKSTIDHIATGRSWHESN